eukprot:8901605-Pyramimonas_sp.AAC.1
MRRRRRTAFTAPSNCSFLEAPTPSHGHRTETFHTEANAGQPANNVRDDDILPTGTNTLLA